MKRKLLICILAIASVAASIVIIKYSQFQHLDTPVSSDLFLLARVNTNYNITYAEMVEAMMVAQYGTNAWPYGPVGGLNLTNARQDFLVTTNCTVTGFFNKSALREQSVVLNLINATTNDWTITIPTPVTTDDGNRTYTVTNGSLRAVSFRYSPDGFTNAISRDLF